MRAAIDAQAAEQGWGSLHAELARVDPQAAARIHLNDPQRIQRALEVYRLTGSTITHLQQVRHAVLAAGEGRMLKSSRSRSPRRSAAACMRV